MIEFFPLEIGIHILNVLILFFVLKKVLYKPIVNYMKKRESTIANKIEGLDEREKSLIQQKELYDTLMAEVDSEAAAIITKSSEMAKDNAREILDYAKEHTRDLVIQAKKEIESEKILTQAGLKNEIADMAISLAEKVLEREISIDDNKKIIREFFERVG